MARALAPIKEAYRVILEPGLLKVRRMANDPKDSKSQIRAQVRPEIKRVSSGERLRLSELACERLQQQKPWQIARAILFYAPMVDELDVSLLWPAAVSERKVIALPQFSPEKGEYVARRPLNASQPLARGQFGIPEPPPDSPPLSLNPLDLVLVPGVAFDLSGRRLGRGYGYYDRMLAKVRGIKCGVAFDQQVKAELPAESHDVRVDCILTPTRWFDFASARF